MRFSSVPRKFGLISSPGPDGTKGIAGGGTTNVCTGGGGGAGLVTAGAGLLDGGELGDAPATVCVGATRSGERKPLKRGSPDSHGFKLARRSEEHTSELQ